MAIDGMDIVTGNEEKGSTLFSKESVMEEGSARASREGIDMEEDSVVGGTSGSKDSLWKEEASLTAKMVIATTLFQLDSDKEASNGSDYNEDNLSAQSGDLDLNLSDYESAADKVSSGTFDAIHAKKYSDPKTFLHMLWNTAGPSVGAMRICLEIIKEELQGQIEGIPTEFGTYRIS